MNFLMGLVLTVLFWILFSSLQEAKDSDKPNGCCNDSTCGKSQFDTFLYWTTMAIAIILTLGVLFEVYDRMTSPGTKLPGGFDVPDILGNI